MTETGAREASHLQKSTFIPNSKWAFVSVLNNPFFAGDRMQLQEKPVLNAKNSFACTCSVK